MLTPSETYVPSRIGRLKTGAAGKRHFNPVTPSYIFRQDSSIDPRFGWATQEFWLFGRQKSQESAITFQPQLASGCSKMGAGAALIK
jgi:hypothetical protein